MVKECEWAYVDGKDCPLAESAPDWECDPRNQDCGDQYGTGHAIVVPVPTSTVEPTGSVVPSSSPISIESSIAESIITTLSTENTDAKKV